MSWYDRYGALNILRNKLAVDNRHDASWESYGDPVDCELARCNKLAVDNRHDASWESYGDPVDCETCGGNAWALRYQAYMTTGKCMNCGNVQGIHDG